MPTSRLDIPPYDFHGPDIAKHIVDDPMPGRPRERESSHTTMIVWRPARHQSGRHSTRETSMKNSMLACVIIALTVAPSSADVEQDIAVAKTLLKATELGAESSDAAFERANAALLTVMSGKPDSDVMRNFRAMLELCFRQECKNDRYWGPENPKWYKSDELLEAQGCYTRAKANIEGCGERDFSACKEPIPENVVQFALENYGMVACVMENERAQSIRSQLYDLFFEEEVEKRLEGVNPTERDAIKSQIGSTDI